MAASAILTFIMKGLPVMTCEGATPSDNVSEFVRRSRAAVKLTRERIALSISRINEAQRRLVTRSSYDAWEMEPESSDGLEPRGVDLLLALREQREIAQEVRSTQLDCR